MENEVVKNGGINNNLQARRAIKSLELELGKQWYIINNCISKKSRPDYCSLIERLKKTNYESVFSYFGKTENLFLADFLNLSFRTAHDLFTIHCEAELTPGCETLTDDVYEEYSEIISCISTNCYEIIKSKELYVDFRNEKNNSPNDVSPKNNKRKREAKWQFCKKYNTTQIATLRNELRKNNLIDQDTPIEIFDYVFNVSDEKNNFEKIKWIGFKNQLYQLLHGLYKGTNFCSIAANVFVDKKGETIDRKSLKSNNAAEDKTIEQIITNVNNAIILS